MFTSLSSPSPPHSPTAQRWCAGSPNGGDCEQGPWLPVSAGVGEAAILTGLPACPSLPLSLSLSLLLLQDIHIDGEGPYNICTSFLILFPPPSCLMPHSPPLPPPSLPQTQSNTPQSMSIFLPTLTSSATQLTSSGGKMLMSTWWFQVSLPHSSHYHSHLTTSSLLTVKNLGLWVKHLIHNMEHVSPVYLWPHPLATPLPSDLPRDRRHSL